MLVICDYAMRYPEVVAMRSVDAEHVAEELVAVFSRVGVPQEILTDGNHWNVEEKQNAKLLSTSP